MKLTSLKLSAKEAKEDMGVPSVAGKSDLPKYPYGLQIRLDTETLQKLGIDLSAYPLGATCVIEARGQITDKSEHQRLGGKERLNLEIQLTDIGISEDKASKKKRVEDKHLNEISGPAPVEAEY